MITTLLLLIWMMSIIFLLLNHPLSFGFILLIQTTLISLITGLLNYNYWYSYILFLIMIGGMLILFMYMTSVASNEKFKPSYLIFSIILMFTLMILLMMIIDPMIINFPIKNLELMNYNMNIMSNLSVSKYMSSNSNMIYMMMIVYLFITLIAIVKIASIQHGPIRQKF